MTRGLKSRVNTLEAKAENTEMDLHKNILHQAYELKLDAYEIAEYLIKASRVRVELLPTLDQDLFSDTQCLADDEANFLEEYRQRTKNGTQFNIDDATVEEVTLYVQDLLSKIKNNH